MSSFNKGAANRDNAIRSTGPRTQAGKNRARRNALRHGLATDLRLDPEWGPQIEEIAPAIAGQQATDEAVLAAARSAAAAELDVIRIRRIRCDLLAQVARLIEQCPHDQPSILALAREEMLAGLGGPELVSAIKTRLSAQPSARASAILTELTRLERYERRALSRRKGLFRHLQTLAI